MRKDQCNDFRDTNNKQNGRIENVNFNYPNAHFGYALASCPACRFVSGFVKFNRTCLNVFFYSCFSETRGAAWSAREGAAQLESRTIHHLSDVQLPEHHVPDHVARRSTYISHTLDRFRAVIEPFWVSTTAIRCPPGAYLRTGSRHCRHEHTKL